MPANPFELRADVRPLDVAAARWAEVGELMARRGDELVEAARRATEGWDSAAAESYEQHRRAVLVNLDRFTALAVQVSGSLRAISSILTSSQQELDRAWDKVALVPHEVVGASRHLVFMPDDDDGRGKVTTSQAEADEVRQRLRLSLDEESGRLRTARAELVTVRTELTTLTGGVFGRRIGPGVGPGFGPGGEESGVGTVLPTTSTSPSTSVPGSAQSGVTAAGLPPVGPISVDMPHLTGLSASALAPFVASAAAGAAGRAAARRAAGATTPAAGGMGMGAMGARAGSMSRGMASGRAGARRLATPRLEGEDAAAAARATQADKEAKRAAVEEKRAARAARKAERAAERSGRTDPSAGTGPTDVKGPKDAKGPRDREDEDDDRAPVDGPEDPDAGGPGDRPAAITVAHYAPGEEPVTDDAPAAGQGEAGAGGAEDVRRS